MSTIYKLLILCGFLVYVAFCKKNKISIVNGGYKDVIISIADNVVVSDEENFIEQLKGLIGSASEKLNKATQNQVYFDEITVSLPPNWSLGSNNTASSATTFENANIRVVNAEDSPLGGGPWTSHSGLCGMQGDYISMTKEFVEGDDQFVQTFGSKEKAIIHEWAHFRWGVFEEYGFPGDSRFPYFYFPPEKTEQVAVYSAKDDLDGVYQTIDGTTCTTSEAGVYGVDCRFFPNEDNATSVSLMSFHYLPSALEFDDTLYHRKAVPSKQNQLCNYESVWETMMKNSEDFPSSSTVTKPTTFKIVKRISSPVIFAIFDAGLSTNPDADIEVIKSHLLSASESFIGKHFGFATYSSATTIKFDVRLPITYLEDSSAVGSALNSVTQSTDTSSTFSYPIDKAIRIVLDYGAPAGAVVYVIGHAGNDYRTGFLEPHVISLASENGIKIISQESGILTTANQLQRISNLTNGAHFQFSGAFSTEELDANLEGILSEFESVKQGLRVVVSEAVIAVQESTLSFTLDALMTDELYFFVTGNRFGVGNLGTCSSKVADPTGVETDSIFQANWGREGNQNAILFSAVTASSGNWTVKTTCTTTSNFWVDVILKTDNIDSVQIKLWSSAVSPENVSPPLRIFAKPMIGQFNAGNLKLKAHIRDVNSVPMPPSQYFTINLGDDGFGDPDTFEDGIYSGVLIPPSGSLSSGTYSIGIEALSEENSWLIASGEKSISADQSQICCGSSFPTSSSVLPSGYRRYFPDLWTFTVSSFTAKFKPPKIIISSLTVENAAKSDLQVTMEWISPRGSATDDTTAVSSYEVRYSSRIESILEGDFAVVDELTECSPVAPGNIQTCRFTISNFTEVTAFFSVAAAVETEMGDFSPVVWSQPLREPSTEITTEITTSEYTNTTVNTSTTQTTVISSTLLTTEATTSTTEELTTESTSMTEITTPSISQTSTIETTSTAETISPTTTGVTSTTSLTTPTTPETSTTLTASTTEEIVTTDLSTPATTESTSSTETTTPTVTQTSTTETTVTTDITPVTTTRVTFTTEEITTVRTPETSSSTETTTPTTPQTSETGATSTIEITSPKTTETTLTTQTTSPATPQNPTTTEIITFTSSQTEATTDSTSELTTVTIVSTTKSSSETTDSSVTFTVSQSVESSASAIPTEETTITSTQEPTSGFTTPEPPCTDVTCEPWFLPVVIVVPIASLIIIAVIVYFSCFKKAKTSSTLMNNQSESSSPSAPKTDDFSERPPSYQPPPQKPNLKGAPSNVSIVSERPTQMRLKNINDLNSIGLGETIEDEDLTLTAL